MKVYLFKSLKWPFILLILHVHFFYTRFEVHYKSTSNTIKGTSFTLIFVVILWQKKYATSFANKLCYYAN